MLSFRPANEQSDKERSTIPKPALANDGRRIYADGEYLSRNPHWHAEDSPYKAGLVKRAIARSGLKPRTIADIGCGAGLVAEIVARDSGAEVVAFDVSPDAASFWPRRQADNLRFVLGDYCSVEDRFDVALCLDVFEHVPDYIGFLQAIRTRSDHIIFNVPLDMCVAKLVSPGIRWAREQVGHLHYFNRYTALATIRDAGYTIEDSFLATPVMSLPPRNMMQAAILLPRLVTGLISSRAAATLLGGYSLVVIAKC